MNEQIQEEFFEDDPAETVLRPASRAQQQQSTLTSFFQQTHPSERPADKPEEAQVTAAPETTRQHQEGNIWNFQVVRRILYGPTENIDKRATENPAKIINRIPYLFATVWLHRRERVIATSKPQASACLGLLTLLPPCCPPCPWRRRKLDLFPPAQARRAANLVYTDGHDVTAVRPAGPASGSQDTKFELVGKLGRRHTAICANLLATWAINLDMCWAGTVAFCNPLGASGVSVHWVAKFRMPMGFKNLQHVLQ
ncbi:uncharacterized protein LOC117647877 [Thrips palmi]|uniref:Uncharacterized protein LOC117647877 n=1 Tax=Thrips palmi TaxID=161013 RepID=A0A6P8ZQF0_THRPL|nr:uncharacterized protein LOC117647877 [Thrips palmi]